MGCASGGGMIVWQTGNCQSALHAYGDHSLKLSGGLKQCAAMSMDIASAEATFAQARLSHLLKLIFREAPRWQ
eukprot:2636827-Amphidinium_carterae.1